METVIGTIDHVSFGRYKMSFRLRPLPPADNGFLMMSCDIDKLIPDFSIPCNLVPFRYLGHDFEVQFKGNNEVILIKKLK